MKKALSIILCFVLLLGVVAVGGEGFAELMSAISLKASAETSGLLTYEISDGKATITSCDKSATGDLEIPSELDGYPITSIGTFAFSYCAGLTSITIPDSVTSIGERAFENCTGLSSVAIGNSVTSIGEGAFVSCTGLTNLTIPDSVTSIGYGAFFGCSGLTSVTIGNSVTSIGSQAFYDCTGLTSITIPDSVTTIGSEAFYGCTGLTSVNIGNSVTSIGEHAFLDCTGLTSIEVDEGNTFYHSVGNCLIETESKTLVVGCNNSVIPDDGSVTSIGSDAFSFYTGLTSITIPDSVTGIGENAFLNCSGLTSVTIGNSVTSIGEFAFAGCTGLTSVTIPDSVTSIGDLAFQFCTGLTSVTIGSGVTSIGSGAFYGCTGLTGITIPDSVTTIGSEAFSGCTGLTSIEVDEGNTAYHSAGNCLVETKSKTLILGFNNSVIPDDGSVTSIGNRAFYGCTGLTEITIPDSVISIGEQAFYGCTGLTGITIPAGVTRIDRAAFSGCAGLTSIEVDEGNTYYHSAGNCLIETGRKILVLGCKNSVIPDDGSVTSIEGAFSGCAGLTSITIPGSVTYIEMNVFHGCTELTSIEVNEGNTVYHSAGNCLILTEYKTLYAGCKNSVIPDDGSVTMIGDGAFMDCTGLTSINIPVSVTSIGYDAFKGCTGLTDVYYAGTEEEWNAILIYGGNSALQIVGYHNSGYNLGEETYGFKNFGGADCCDSTCKQAGHCFGMAMTCAGYYNGALARPQTGFESGSLYTETASDAIKEPIHFYQLKQGSIVEQSTVAGGTYFKTLGQKTDPSSDWREVTDYVKNHDYDNKGLLQIGYKGVYWVNNKKRNLNHAVSFLYYREVDGQQRVYAYDNEYPDRETYFYEDSSGTIYQSVGGSSSSLIEIKCIALRDVLLYLSKAEKFKPTNCFYAENGAVTISNSQSYFMEADNEDAEEVIIEVTDGVTEVAIIPQYDNASFQYMGKEYSFDKVDDDTVGKFILAAIDEDGNTVEQPVFEIENDPELKVLTEAKEAAKAEIDKAVPAGASDKVKAIANVAKQAIDSAADTAAVEAAKNKGINDIKAQLDKEAGQKEEAKKTEIAIRGWQNVLKVDYRSKVTFNADVTNSAGKEIIWCDKDGKKLGTGASYTTEVKKDMTVMCKTTDADGNEVTSQVEEIKLNSSSFITKIIAFFKSLFGSLPEYVDNQKVKK